MEVKTLKFADNVSKILKSAVFNIFEAFMRSVLKLLSEYSGW